MPLILSHGQPKSGSSYLFQIAKGAVELKNGLLQRKVRDRYLTEILPNQPDFLETITDDAVAAILRLLPPETYYVLKTHRPLPPDTRRAIERGKIVAFTSFRDPRDIVVSLLDHARTARAQAKKNEITAIVTLDQAISNTVMHFAFLHEWTECRNVVAFPFYLVASERDYTVRTLCSHIGLQSATDAMRDRFGSRGTARIWMFEKGIPDRFTTDFTKEIVQQLNVVFASQVKITDRLTFRWMSHHHRQALYLRMRACREAALRVTK